MAEHQEWTAGDDARVRAALGTLRADVDALPLADPRFVRARGARRRRQRMVAWTAAAAAAVVVAGAVGYGQLGRDATLPTPPARTPTPLATTPTTPAPTDPLDTPGLLPLAAEWQQSLDLPAGAVTVDPVTKGGGVECGAVVGDLDRQEAVRVDGATTSGGASHWTVEGSLDRAVTDLRQAVASCVLAPDFDVTARRSTADWALYSYVAPGAGSGWFAVTGAHDDAVLLQVVEPDAPTTALPEDAVAALAATAHARLQRYGAASTASPTTTGGPGATSEDMPVSGPEPRPSAALFVAASQWGSEALTGGAKTSAGPGALEGSTAVVSCETDEQQAGVGGRVGVVSIRVGSGTTGYVGRQRVQLDEATDPGARKDYVAARLSEADKVFGRGCTFGNGTVRAVKGPTSGTYRLDTVFADGSPTTSEWVGVTSQRTPGAVSTIVLTRVADPDSGFAELDRLLALARQR